MMSLLKPVLAIFLSLQLAMPAAEPVSFDDYFYQSSFFSVTAQNYYNSGIFGHWYDMKLLETRDGTVYIGALLLRDLVSGADSMAQEPGVEKVAYNGHWFCFCENTTEVTDWEGNVIATLQHAPYQISAPGDGGWYPLMLPLRETINLLGLQLAVRDGVIAISSLPGDAFLSADGATIARIKQELERQLTDTFLFARYDGDDVYVSSGTALVRDGVKAEGNEWELHGGAFYTPQAEEDGKLSVYRRPIGGEQTLFCTLVPEEWESNIVIQDVRVRGDVTYLLTRSGQSAMSSYNRLYAVKDGVASAALLSGSIGNWYVTDSKIYYSQYGSVGGSFYDLQVLDLASGVVTPMPSARYGAGGMVRIGDTLMLTVDDALTKLDLSGGTLTTMVDVPVSAFRIMGGRLLYESEGAWYCADMDGQNAVQTIAGTTMAVTSDAVYVVNDDGTLTRQPFGGAAEAMDAHRVQALAADKDALYYATYGYDAAVYCVRGGVTERLLEDSIYDIAQDRGAMLLIPESGRDYYYRYQDGVMQKYAF